MEQKLIKKITEKHNSISNHLIIESVDDIVIEASNLIDNGDNIVDLIVDQEQADIATNYQIKHQIELSFGADGALNIEIGE